MSVTKSNHCAYSTHYHIVFPVKYRRALLSEPIVASIKLITKELEERYEFIVERLGMDQNHIHIAKALSRMVGF